MDDIIKGQIDSSNNRKGNIVVFNREKDVVLQNSAFIEDSFAGSDEEMSAESVSNGSNYEKELFFSCN